MCHNTIEKSMQLSYQNIKNETNTNMHLSIKSFNLWFYVSRNQYSIWINILIWESSLKKISFHHWVWKINYSEAYFESKLDSAGRRKYRRYLKLRALTSDEKMVTCLYWGKYKIWKTSKRRIFFYCNHTDWGEAFCTICNESVDNDRDERDTKEEQIDYEKEVHPTWVKYAEMRKEWDMILQKGAMRFCPNPSCKTGGVKDTDCTHMKWFTCGTNYCYFWGKAEANWDKSKPEPGLARHNDNWNTNPKRCPIFLLQIQEIDKRWKTEDDDVCLKLFHKLLTYKYIKKFIKKHTREKFDDFWNAFNIQEESGLNIDDIYSTNLKMIRRK